MVFIYLVSLGLTHLNPSFFYLSLVSMGFILGFMANESFFKEDSASQNKYPITEGDTLANIRNDSYFRKMPIGPPPSLHPWGEEKDQKCTCPTLESPGDRN